MEEKEKYRAQVQAQMIKFHETLSEIKLKMQKRNENQPDLSLDPFIQKHEKAQAKLKELEQADEKSWPVAKAELDDMMGDMDAELRKAWAYLP